MITCDDDKKNILWAGNAFDDCFYMLKDNRFYSLRQNGGVFNCRIDSFNNFYRPTLISNECIFLFINDKQEKVELFTDTDLKVDDLYLEFSVDWLHISYIDALPLLDLSKIDRSRIKKISCDLCYPRKKIVSDDIIKKNIDYCDIVFANYDKGVFYDTKKLIIYHSPYGSFLQRGLLTSKFETKFKNYFFTVGAGDKFACFFIEKYINGGNELDSQKYAHEKVEQWLIEVNKKYEV